MTDTRIGQERSGYASSEFKTHSLRSIPSSHRLPSLSSRSSSWSRSCLTLSACSSSVRPGVSAPLGPAGDPIDRAPTQIARPVRRAFHSSTSIPSAPELGGTAEDGDVLSSQGRRRGSCRRYFCDRRVKGTIKGSRGDGTSVVEGSISMGVAGKVEGVGGGGAESRWRVGIRCASG